MVKLRIVPLIAVDESMHVVEEARGASWGQRQQHHVGDIGVNSCFISDRASTLAIGDIALSSPGLTDTGRISLTSEVDTRFPQGSNLEAGVEDPLCKYQSYRAASNGHLDG